MKLFSIAKTKNFHVKVLFAMIFLYIVFFSGFSIWKYLTFQYNGLDLAILNQVFYNSSEGRFFEFSIHPQKYLGDHFTPIMFLFLPMYGVFQSPIFLLVLQSIMLGLAAIPLFLICKKKLSENWSLFVCLGYLLNPFAHNVNSYEFHLLSVSVFFLFWLYYFYQKKNFKFYLLFLLLSLLVREDVSLVVVMFSIVALIDQIIEKRKNKNFKFDLKWIITPLILGIAYFLLAMKISDIYSLNGKYKFLVYYSWLGSNFAEIIKNMFFHPLNVVWHLLKYGNFEFVLALLLPFFFIILLRPKNLLLAFLVFLQFVLAEQGAGALVFSTHYIVLFVPALFLAFIDSIDFVLKWDKQRNIDLDLKIILFLALLTSFIYSSLALGILFGFGKKILLSEPDKNITQIKKYFVSLIPKEAKVASSYEFLPALSSRKNLYSLHYAFSGKTQYNFSDYSLPFDVEYLLFDFNDFLLYQFQMSDDFSFNQRQSNYFTGDERIRKLLENYQLIDIFDTIALFKKGLPAENKLFVLTNEQDLAGKITEMKNIQEKISQVSISNKKFANQSFPLLLRFQCQSGRFENNYRFNLLITDKNNKEVYKKTYPIAYGIYPTSKWNNEEILASYFFYIPQKYLAQIKKNEMFIDFFAVDQKGILILDKVRYALGYLESEKELKEIKIEVK